MPPTKRGEERKVEVTASCDSYSLPRSHLSFFLSFFPSSTSRQQWGSEKEAQPAIGASGKREGDGEGSAAAPAASRQEQQSREGGRGKKEKACDSVSAIK